jgi:Zn-dependent protease
MAKLLAFTGEFTSCCHGYLLPLIFYNLYQCTVFCHIRQDGGAGEWSCYNKRHMDIGYIAIVIGVVLLSMTLHEAMHAFMGYWLGDDTAKLQGRLTLNPIKHIDPFLTILLPVMLAIVGGPIFGGAKPVPFNPDRVRYDEWGAALVAVAGPLTNLLIAFVTYGVYVLVGGIDAGLLGQVLIIAVTVNLGFFVFNMLPIPPLDGSRVLYALAPEFIRRGMEAIERLGIFVIFAIVLVASPVIGAFMGTSIDFFIDIFAQIFGRS